MTGYLQALADERAYGNDPTCQAGFRLDVMSQGGACKVGAVAVAGAAPSSVPGTYALALKFEDGVWGALFVSAHAFRAFRAPGTPAFVQFYNGHIVRFGNYRYAEVTAGDATFVTRRARDTALRAAGVACVASALATFAAAVAGRRRRS